jgi:tRNA A37 threonylcarbamoyladenosine modification protein TsaB
MIIIYDVTGREGEILAKHTALDHIQWSSGKHAEILGQNLNRLMEKHHLEKVGVITGPGSFTGIRIGLAMAMGLGATWSEDSTPDIEIYARSRFDLAWSMLEDLSLENGNGVFFPGPRDRVYCQTSPTSEIEIKRYDELKGLWYGTGTKMHSGHRALNNLCRHFLKEIEEKTILPTKKPVPLYIRPADAVAGIPLLQRLLSQ